MKQIGIPLEFLDKIKNMSKSPIANTMASMFGLNMQDVGNSLNELKNSDTVGDGLKSNSSQNNSLNSLRNGFNQLKK